MKNEPNNILESLRKKAEHLISADRNSTTSHVDKIQVQRIFHELQVYQLELEMQNDELQITTQELEQQKTRFANLFELAPISYFVLDKSGVIKDVNQAGATLLDVDKVNLTNKPLLLFIHKEDTESFYKYFRKVTMLPQVQSFQLRLVNAKNQIFNVQIEGNAMHTATETECYLTVTDFTGKQQAEQKLQEAKKTLEIAMDASLTGIWEIDIVTGKVILDDFCCSLYGIKHELFDGRYETLLNGIYPADRKNVDESIRQTLFNEKDFNIKFRTNTPNGRIKYVQARAQIIKDQRDRKRFIGTFIDISEKTIIEQEAARIKEEQQQKILASGLQAEEKEKKRISEVLHDGIAQMLYAIKLDMEHLKSTAPPDTFNHVHQLITSSIKEIRNVSFELTPSILTDFGLAATLEDLTARLSNPQLSFITIVKGINKSLDIQMQLNMYRIIQELINNAIKHAKASKIVIEVNKQNKNISIVVSDNGIGFNTDNQNEPPKGIGLSSIRNRLRLYKGNLKIESELGAGTIVYLNLKN